MKNFLPLFIFAFLLFTSSPAQVIPTWISNGHFPEANASTPSVVAVDPSGNIIVGGTTGDNFVMKHNASGEVLWLQTYQSTDTISFEPNTLCIDNQGNAYITFVRHIAGSYSSIAVQKYSAFDGEILWASELPDAQCHGFEWQVKPKFMTIDDNHLYVAGTKFDPVTGDREMLAMKLDMNGNILWTATHAGTGNSNSKCITVDQNGNVYIAGDAWNASIDYCIVKYDPDGNLLWDVFLDDEINQSTDIAEYILVDNNTNVYVTGYSNIESGGKDILTAKYNQNGTLQWKQYYGNPDYRTNNAYYLEKSESGDLYVGGYSSDLDPYPGSGKDYLLLKYDPNGNLLWDARYDYKNFSNDHPFDFDIGPEGNIYICGITMKSCYVYKFITAVKVNPQGEIEWDIRIPELFGTPWEIAVIDEDQFVVAAGAFDTIQINDATVIHYETAAPPVYEADILDVYFESQISPPIIDYNNQHITATVHDTANIEFLVPFITRSEHSCMYPKDELVTSFVEPIWYNITSFDDEIEKWWIVEVDGGYVGIDGHLLEDIKIFPNPATDKLEIKSSEFTLKNCTITLHDLNGKTLIEKQIAKGHEKAEIDLRNLQCGMYFCTIRTDKKSMTKKLIKD